MRRKAILTIRLHHGLLHMDDANMAQPIRSLLTALGALAAMIGVAGASDFSEPWKREDRALVIDAYEYNPIDWPEMVSDKRIVGFINKASDGLAPAYYCSGDVVELRLCKTLWRRHAVAQELFQTRRTLAKALGLKWGAYHLARPGNPLEQAENFLDFAKPGPDDLMALDIEENDPDKWMSLADAETFVQEIRRRTGRYPILYTNGNTARHIADNRSVYPLLSRLPLWYARYKPEIGMHFPKGNWESYALWQFSAQANCNARRCPYRVAGTKYDIDVNVTTLTPDELRRAWPFGGLLGPPPVDVIATVPVPVSRTLALAGDVELSYAQVELEPGSLLALAYAFLQAGERYPARSAPRPLRDDASAPKPVAVMASATAPAGYEPAMDADSDPEAFRGLTTPVAALAGSVDPMTTAAVQQGAPSRAGPSLRFKRHDFPVFLLEALHGGGEDFEDLFGRPSQHSAALADNDRPVDQNWVSDHEVDQLLVTPFRIVEAERGIGRVLAPQQVTR